MIKISIEEYKEGNKAVRTVSVTFFSILIYKYKYTTSNNDTVSLFTTKEQPIIKGFKNDN